MSKSLLTAVNKTPSKLVEILIQHSFDAVSITRYGKTGIPDIVANLKAVEFQIASEVKCDAEGKGTFSIRAIARMADISHQGLSKSLLTGGNFSPSIMLSLTWVILVAIVVSPLVELMASTMWGKSLVSQ